MAGCPSQAIRLTLRTYHPNLLTTLVMTLGGAMRYPIDTSRLRFLVVAPAEELRQFEEGKPREAWARRTDANGEVLWRVQLVALGDGDAEIIRVTVPGDPKVGQGEMVRVQEMTVQGWEMDGRSGM